MTPLPQEQSACGAKGEVGPALDGERVVISGMSGLFPESHHVNDLSDILYNKVNPVSKENCRWKFTHPEMQDYTGKIPEVDLFDAQFFKINFRQAEVMDNMGRKILEQAYQAIYDAGINPNQLSEKVGVYIGCGFSECEMAIHYCLPKSGLGISGGCRAMFANRISYWLNAKGPSISIDDSCCSSMACLEQAYLAISRGACEAAIVGGVNLCLHPHSSIHYGRMMPLCKDGKTKCFDQNADGFAVSEAINTLFLQKAKDARRIYADVIHVKCEYRSLLREESGPQYGFIRNPEDTTDFIRSFYEQAKIPPQLVEYVEAFGSATPEADKSELQAIEKVFCENRTDPLFVGSVISNIGYSEGASGISAITKVLLGYHKGEMAANLHCETRRQDIASLNDGRMRIVTEHQPFRRTYTAVNALSVTGLNAHVLLHGHYKPKDSDRYKTDIPRLVTISGRKQSSVTKIIDDLKSRPIDPEELALLHNIHEEKIAGHLGRGFTILDTNAEQKTVSLCERADYFDDVKRPLWFVYSGMGSQWAGMGAQLMRIPIFAAAIERCHKTLEPKGIDVMHIITSTDKTIFDNILHSFVGIAAIQIGLTDILLALGLVPDNIIGHSVGEICCAYADGCLTAEEVILVAYCRGLVSIQTPFIKGSMAAIGIGYHEIRKICPPEIEVACHNGPESCTISGPADKMREFVAELTAKQIFAKEVPCSNIAYHSRYIAEAGPGLLEYLKEVIKDPKPRSERWLSTSKPQDKWDQPAAKYCSAEYHTDNLLNPVLFEETSRLVPSNAVLVEIAPHGLLQAILKRSLPASCRNIPLTRRGHPDNVYLLLEAVGSLYMEGYNPRVRALYPTVEFPVSTGTPHLSHLVEWAHEEKWRLPLLVTENKKIAAAAKFVISVHDNEHLYLKGNILRGKMVYPFAGALVAAWDTLAMSLGVERKELSVHFSDVHLYAQPVLHAQRQLRLSVALHRGTGRFEVMENISKIATGFILRHNVKYVGGIHSEHSEESTEETLDADAIYQTFLGSDYSLSGEFRSIASVNKSLTEADIVWSNNWVTFLDGVLQFNALRHAHDTVSQPCYIRRLCIDVKEHAISKLANNSNLIKANACDIRDCIRCGGITINNTRFRDIPLITGNFMLKPINVTPNNQEALSMRCGVTLQCATIGDLDSLHWVEAPEPTKPGVMVTVHYAGINNIDVNKASGVIPLEGKLNNSYGMDFSGVTDSGERVMGIVSGGAASSRVRARPELLWPVPAHWSLEDAATVPLAYAHAFYCLGVKSLPARDITVLVHGGAGGLGQAAISVALGLKYQVFTTVSDIHKKRFLRKLFPELKDEHIGNSRDGSFGDMVMHATNGKGCDIVISSVKGQLKNVSFKCCALFGIFFDTVQLPYQEHFYFGMNNLINETNYFTTDFSSIFEHKTKEEVKNIQLQVSEGIARGYVRPLSRVSYEPQAVGRAFRLLASSRHRGRVLLRLQDSTLPAQPRLTCTAHGSHVVVCDDGLLGLQLADRLITRGARNVLLHCPLPPKHICLKIRSWRNMGATVIVSSARLRSTSDVSSLVASAAQLGPVEGVYVAATTADSNTVRHLTDVLAHLDTATRTGHRTSCPSLRYFAVVCQDVSVGLPICQARLQDRLPATMITWLKHLQKIDNLANNIKVDLSWFRLVCEATEQAVCSPEPVVMIEQQHENTSLLHTLTSAADLTIPEDFPSTCTLEDLGLAEDKLQVVSALLRDVHNVCLAEEEIMALTIQTITELDTSTLESPLQHLKGLESFISYVDSDELVATNEIVSLPTLTNSLASIDEFDASQTHLCVIPGMEGHHQKFRVLCERLKLPALVLQPGLDHLHETVRDTAQRFANILLKRAGLKNNFYLLGFESGVLVALEMAFLLEKQGLTGTVFCLGGGPDEIVGELEAQVGEYRSEEELQEAVMRHMYALMAGGDTAGLEDALRPLSSWPLKLEACVRTLLGRVPHSAQYARSLIEAAYASITRARSYTAQPRPLRSRIVLLRAAIDSAPALNAPKLQCFSQQPIAVHQLTMPLAHAPNDLQCAAVINNNLGQQILDAFDRKNLCETYLINFEKYMNLSFLE